MTIPNFITIIRVLFIPVNLVYLIEENYKLALICFLVAAFSDFLDGFLARALDQKSSLGGFLDPMADKLLVSANLVTLLFYKLVPAWYVVFVFSRDLFILIGFVLSYIFYGTVYILPSILGKITVFCQMISILAILLNASGLLVVTQSWMAGTIIVAFVLTIISGLDYLFRWLIHHNKSTPEITTDIRKLKK